MECDFSRANYPGKASPIQLNAVYSLHVDKSYDVNRSDTGRTGYVALRTLGGTGKISIKGISSLTLYTDSLIFFENSHVKKYYCNDESWVFWWFEFHSEEKMEFPLNEVIHISYIQKELTDCNTCLEMLKINTPASNCMATATMNALYYQWLMKYQNSAMTSRPYNSDIQKVIQYIKSNMNTPLKVNEMANMVGLSERRFRQIFEAVIGMAPKKYYETIRIEMAQELLKMTSLSILQISERLGYSSQFHFSRAFSDAYGSSPSGYRKK